MKVGDGSSIGECRSCSSTETRRSYANKGGMTVISQLPKLSSIDAGVDAVEKTKKLGNSDLIVIFL